MTDAQLINDLTAIVPQWLKGRLHGWLVMNTWVRFFAASNAAKIIGKIKNAKSDEDKADVVAELEVAYRLLANPGISLTYEPDKQGGKRHADFRAIYDGCDFTVEFKRIREPEAVIAAQAGAMKQGGWTWPNIPYTQKESFKFSDHLTGCLGQLRPDMGNVLVVKIDSSTHEPIELHGAIYELLKGELPESYFHNKKFTERSDFLTQWRLLSAAVVLTRWESLEGERGNACWYNDGAAHPLPNDVVRHLQSM